MQADRVARLSTVRLNRTLFHVAVLLFAHSVTAQPWQEPVPTELSAMTVRVCGNSAYPPVSWVNRQNQIDGVNATVIRRLLEPLGITVDARQTGNWRRCLKEVELGNVDMLSGFKTDLRQQFMVYLNAPVVRESIYLYFPIASPLEFTDWQALSGLRVGVLMGDSFGDEVDAALRQYPSLEYVSTQDQNLLKLADNRLDVVPMGKLSGQLDVRRLGLEGRIGQTATDVTDFWYLAISKQSPLVSWLPLLNQRLTKLMENTDAMAVLVTHHHQAYLTDLGLEKGPYD